MSFSFSLQKILNWKRSLEEQAQILLAQKCEELKRQEKEIQKLIQRRIHQAKELEEKLKKGLKGAEFTLYHQFNEWFYRDILERKISKLIKEQEVESERKNLIKLMTERKILEKLRDKRLKETAYHQDKEEQKFVDELSVRKHFGSSPKSDHGK
jgi:flagellar FliJ protein